MTTANMAAKILFAVIVATALSACSPPFKNAGKTALKHYTIDASSSLSKSGVWQTSNVRIEYSTEASPSPFAPSASIEIMDNVLLSFPAVDFLYVYINYLDKEGKVISTHDISPNAGYLKVLTGKLKLGDIPAAPAEATAFTFSYWGNFRAIMTSEKNSGDWEIFFNPFE